MNDSDDRPSVALLQTVDTENIDPSNFVEDTKGRKRSEQTLADSEPNIPKRAKKDPKLIAKSYQKFMTKTYDVQDENDYHTIFNTSVNRNGYEVAPRDARPDVTKLFSVETTDSNMEVTKLLPGPSFATKECIGIPSAENNVTRLFDQSSAAMSLVDFSESSREMDDNTRGLASMDKEEDSSAGNIGDISEMDTAMIIEEDLEVTDDEVFETQQRSALIPSRFIEQSTIDEISMSITEDMSRQVAESESMNCGRTVTSIGLSEDIQIVNQPETDSISLIHFENTEEVAEKVRHQDERLEPSVGCLVAERTTLEFSIPTIDKANEGLLVSFEVDQRSAEVDMENKTKCFDPKSDLAQMMIDNDMSVVQFSEKTNIFSDNVTGNRMSIENDMNEPSPPNSQEVSSGSQPMDKETTEFGVKSSTFQRRQTLSKMMSRFSFPRSLDNVLEMRKRQLTQNYFDSLQNIELSESIESISCSPQVPSPLTQKSLRNSSSKMSLSTSNCSTPKKSPERLFGPRSLVVKNLSARMSGTPKSVKPVPNVSIAVSIHHPESSNETMNTADAGKLNQECPTISTSFNSSSSTISEMELDGVNFDKSYNLSANFDEGDDDRDDLHEDSMFEIVNRIHESSFLLSPDSSLQSSFVCMDDTLAMRAEDLDCKLNSFQFSDDETTSGDPDKDFQGVFVPLRKFDADKYGARLDLSSTNEPVVYFLYDLIEVHVTFGATARSLNGIPIKFIQKLLVKSALTNNDRFIPNQSSSTFLIPFNENHQWFFKCTSDLVVTSFEENKGQLLKKHPTSDLLPDLLREVAQWVMRGGDLLHEITAISQFTNCYFYQKLGNIYE